MKNAKPRFIAGALALAIIFGSASMVVNLTNESATSSPDSLVSLSNLELAQDALEHHLQARTEIEQLIQELGYELSEDGTGFASVLSLHNWFIENAEYWINFYSTQKSEQKMEVQP